MASNTQVATRNTGLANKYPTITTLSVGALVGVINNEEFSKGGRSLKFSRNAWLSFRLIAPSPESNTAGS